MSDSVTMVGPNIELGPVLGSGGFGKVYCGYDRKRQENVAVKVINKALVKRNGIEEYVSREIQMMRKIKSPYIVRLYEAIETSSSYNLVMELAPNGELFDKIVTVERFDEDTARRYFQQLIHAVLYCHSHHIVHRDLKAENLLVAADNTLRLCDFGLSRYTRENSSFDDNNVLFMSLAGSIDYQAPEILMERGYGGSQCDMWSCGAILFFMLCGYLPFTDRTDGLTRKRILTNQYNRNNKYLSPSAADLISHLLDRDPKTRYTCHDVIHHPWFQVNLDFEMFPGEAPVSPQSPGTPGDFIHREETPKESMNADSPTTQLSLDIRQAFSSVNVTGDGYLNKEEVRDALIKLNQREVSDQELQEFLSNFQLNKDGCITEEEFVIGWTKHQNKLGKKYDIRRMGHLFHYNLEKEFLQTIRKTFDSIDKEHTGTITKANIMQMGLEFTESEVQKLFDVVNPEHPGRSYITFENFVKLSMRYDLLKNSTLAIRLRRLEEVFELTEMHSLKSSLNTGYTVSGSPPIIKALLISKSEQLHTAFEEGETKGYLYGTHKDANGKFVLEVGVRLMQSVHGYTKVVAYRIRGKTPDFHKWFLSLRKCMKDQLLMCEEDTAIKGEPELM
eukprot:gene4440-3239_t